MKAIETKYKGYHFRSRLEARWAVFFDVLGIKWAYEPEGFDLSNGTRYLPDFWLPIQQHIALRFGWDAPCGRWIEIKGQEPSAAEVEKMRLLALESRHTGIIFTGDPCDYIATWCYVASPKAPKGGTHVRRSQTLTNEHDAHSWAFNAMSYYCRQDGTEHDGERLTKQEVVSALTTSRSARFEHGEEP